MRVRSSKDQPGYFSGRPSSFPFDSRMSIEDPHRSPTALTRQDYFIRSRSFLRLSLPTPNRISLLSLSFLSFSSTFDSSFRISLTNFYNISHPSLSFLSIESVRILDSKHILLLVKYSRFENFYNFSKETRIILVSFIIIFLYIRINLTIVERFT